MTPADIDHVNAHATSTPEGDKSELQAIRTIFGDDVGRISVTANKSMMGHTLGAAGAHRGDRHDPDASATAASRRRSTWRTPVRRARGST